MYKILNLIVLFAALSNLQAQELSFDGNNVTEEIKLNTDRELYFSNEIIFFNADYFINNSRTLPKLSNVIYLELIECANNKSVIQKKYYLDDFNVNGSIAIPNDLNTGNYLLRAFTQYQRNLSGFKYSYRFITILNPNNNSLSKSNETNNDSVYIAPEGGFLIDGIKNNVVINIPNKFISDSNLYYIKDENNSVLKKISPNEFGITKTTMVFESTKKYSIVIENNTEQEIITTFPKVKQNGIQTNLLASQYNINYKIQVKELPEDNRFKLKIFSDKFDELYTQSLNINNETVNVHIDKSTLTKGINYLLLLDYKSEITNINSVYVSDNSNNITINSSKDIYEPNEIITLNATVNNQDIDGLTNVLVSATREGTRLTERQLSAGVYTKHPILLNNVLESSLIADTEVLEQIMILADNQIDKNILNEFIVNPKNDTLEYIPEIRNLTVKGVLQNKKTKEPIPNHNVYLSVLFNNPQLHIYTTRSNGEFIFSLNKVYGKNDIYICSEPASDIEEEYEILIKSAFPPEVSNLSTIPFLISEEDLPIIKEVYRNAQIKQKIHGNESIINTNNEKKTSTEFNLNDNKTTIIPDNFVAFQNMQELFYEIVSNVIVKKDNDNYFFKVLDENDYMLIGTPLLLVDHIPVFDPNKIMQLNPAQIERIEVIYKTYILGSHTLNGVIMITTNTKNFAELALPTSATFLEYEALENTHISLKSDTTQVKEQSKNNIPDFKTTLYWNAKVKLNPSNKAEIVFKASDSKGTYNIDIVGYNNDGTKFFGKKKIIVK